ncbi:SAM-dependent methyltransferase [Actinoplanes sp. NPDC026623]|jgi:hypothetical protein|uniref:SAM-dependent methyltransferase n=1 Tax=Actinoplanes sp. NPDC026623 TaxID=3155610 RepID=UPI0033D0A011
MALTEDETSAHLQPDVPHAARIWNYWMGGKDNVAADRAAGVPYILRSPDEIGSLFDGLEMEEPGLVQITQWRPDGEAEWLDAYGAVARKP